MVCEGRAPRTRRRGTGQDQIQLWQCKPRGQNAGCLFHVMLPFLLICAPSSPPQGDLSQGFHQHRGLLLIVVLLDVFLKKGQPPGATWAKHALKRHTFSILGSKKKIGWGIGATIFAVFSLLWCGIFYWARHTFWGSRWPRVDPKCGIPGPASHSTPLRERAP